MGGAKLEWDQAVAWGRAEHLVEPHSALERRGLGVHPRPPPTQRRCFQCQGPGSWPGPGSGSGSTGGEGRGTVMSACVTRLAG